MTKLKTFCGPANEVEVEYNEWMQSRAKNWRLIQIVTQLNTLYIFYKD